MISDTTIAGLLITALLCVAAAVSAFAAAAPFVGVFLLVLAVEHAAAAMLAIEEIDPHG